MTNGPVKNDVPQVLVIIYTERRRPRCVAAVDRKQAMTVLEFLEQTETARREMAHCFRRILESAKEKKVHWSKLSIGVNVKQKNTGLVTATKEPLTGTVIRLLTFVVDSPITAALDLLRLRLREFAAGGPGGTIRPFYDMEFAKPVLITPDATNAS